MEGNGQTCADLTENNTIRRNWEIAAYKKEWSKTLKVTRKDVQKVYEVNTALPKHQYLEEKKPE